jgi:hypothetical protein
MEHGNQGPRLCGVRRLCRRFLRRACLGNLLESSAQSNEISAEALSTFVSELGRIKPNDREYRGHQ